MKEQNKRNNRREFLKKAGGLLLVSGAVLPQRLQASPAFANPVGYSATSWPRNKFDDAMLDISALGFKGIQIPGGVRNEYRGQATTLKARLDILKLKPAAMSCTELSLSPVQTSDPSSQLKSYAAFMKQLGGRNLQITDGGRAGARYTAGQIKTLGSRMNHLGKLAQDSGLALGYQPAFGTLGGTREGLNKVLAETDSKYVKLIAGVAQLALCGCDPAEVIRTHHDRLLFLHFQDVAKDVLAEARKNRSPVQKSGLTFCEIGKGGVDFPAVLKAIRNVSFSGWVIIELNGRQPGLGPAESARVNRDALRRMGFRV